MRTNVAASTRAFLERTQEQELVGEAQEAAIVAALGNYQGKLGRLFTTWIHKRGRSSLLSPFGLLEIWSGKGFTATRNGAPLRHDSCRPERASIFLTREAAQVAAELNMTLGWSTYGREPDCLSFTWSDDSHLGEPGSSTMPRPSQVDDDLVYANWELVDRCKGAYPFWWARNEHPKLKRVVPHLNGLRHAWEPDFGSQPDWSVVCQGHHELQTPYGELAVRRANNAGWIIEKNGLPLVYSSAIENYASLKVVFGDVADAKTLALLYAFPPNDILQWGRSARPETNDTTESVAAAA